MIKNLVILSGYTTNPGDLNWDEVSQLADQVDIYERSTREEAKERARDAEVIILNKLKVNDDLLACWPKVKCIIILATGYDNIDLEACSKRKVAVFNAKGYSTSSVVQHTFGLIFQLVLRLDAYNQSVKQGDWYTSKDFCYYLYPTKDLSQLTIGIIGFGGIGQGVAEVAKAFGMKVVVYSRTKEKVLDKGYDWVTLDDLLRLSDIVTLHIPLTESSHHIVNNSFLDRMKSSAYLINTARGGHVDLVALKEALKDGKIAGAALDVLDQEPPSTPIIGLELENLIITPHVAWGNQQARINLMAATVANLQRYLAGDFRDSLSALK